MLSGCAEQSRPDSRQNIVHTIEGNFSQAQVLIDRGADTSAADPATGNGLVAFAVSNQQTNFLNFLIDRGVDVNHRNNTGMTLIMFAMIKKNHSAIEMLVDRGADLEARNNAPGFTAYMLTDPNDDVETMRLLEQVGAKICGGSRRCQDVKRLGKYLLAVQSSLLWRRRSHLRPIF